MNVSSLILRRKADIFTISALCCYSLEIEHGLKLNKQTRICRRVCNNCISLYSLGAIHKVRILSLYALDVRTKFATITQNVRIVSLFKGKHVLTHYIMSFYAYTGDTFSWHLIKKLKIMIIIIFVYKTAVNAKRITIHIIMWYGQAFAWQIYCNNLTSCWTV